MTNAATIYDEFDAVSDLSFGAMYTRILDEGQAVFAGGSIGFASEGGADFGDSLVWGAFGGMSFRVSDTLRIGAGVGVFSRLEESVRVVPLPQITLKIDERWTLKSEGPGLKLDHKWNDDLHFGVAARFEGNDFRIDSDNSIVPEGAVSESGIPITGYIDLASAGGNANISLFAEVGVIVAGETEIFDAAGNTVVEDDIDPGVYAGLTLRIRF